MAGVISVVPPYPTFFDVDGESIEDGFIYVGTTGLNPLIGANQVALFSDSALTIPIAQPVRTSGGYPVRSGSPTRIYVGASDYSVLVTDKHGALVYSSLTNVPKLGLINFVTIYYDPTLAEIAAGVDVRITRGYRAPGDMRRYNGAIDGVTDDTTPMNDSLLQSYQSGGAPAYWPAGTILVGALTISAPCKVITEGLNTLIKNTNPAQFDTPIIKITGSNVELGDLSFTGAIATQAGEWNHCVSIRPNAANVTNVKLGRLIGTNIRGDVLALEGIDAFTVKTVQCVSVFGTNIYRNGVSFIGCEDVDVGSIECNGRGYRDFDVEPNVGSQNPTGIRIGYVRGSTIQFAGQDPVNDFVGVVDVDYLDLDNNRQINSAPGYPSFANQAGNIGIIMGNTQKVHIGGFKARNYQERLFNNSAVATLNGRVSIDFVDIANCNTTEAVFKTLFNCDGLAEIEIKGGTIALTALDRYITKGAAANTRVRLRNLAISGGAISATATNAEFENLEINASGLASNLFATVLASIMKNVNIINAAAATFMNACTNNILENVTITGAVANLNTGGGNHLYQKCSFNSVNYELRTEFQNTIAWDPGNIVNGAIEGKNVTVSGAVPGDFVQVAMDIDIQGMTLTAQVAVANTVQAILTNNTGGAINLGPGVLAARVWKR